MLILLDFIDVVNAVLREERKAKDIEAKGYFRFDEFAYAASLDNQESLEIKIYYHADDDIEYPVITIHHTLSTGENIPYENRKVFLMALREFYKVLKYGTGEYDYSRFVDGTFNYILTLDSDEVSNA